MSKMLMIKTTKGSEDGIVVKEFKAGQTYDTTQKMLNIFVSLGVAEEVTHVRRTAPIPKVEVEEAPEVLEDKAEKDAPENKDDGPAPSNKKAQQNRKDWYKR